MNRPYTVTLFDSMLFIAVLAFAIGAAITHFRLDRAKSINELSPVLEGLPVELRDNGSEDQDRASAAAIAAYNKEMTKVNIVNLCKSCCIMISITALGAFGIRWLRMKSFRRLGTAQCVLGVAVFSLFYCSTFSLIEYFFKHRINQPMLPYVLLHFGVKNCVEIGPYIPFSWLLSAVDRRWSLKGWSDSIGLILGTSWIVTSIVANLILYHIIEF